MKNGRDDAGHDAFDDGIGRDIGNVFETNGVREALVARDHRDKAPNASVFNQQKKVFPHERAASCSK